LFSEEYWAKTSARRVAAYFGGATVQSEAKSAPNEPAQTKGTKRGPPVGAIALVSFAIGSSAPCDPPNADNVEWRTPSTAKRWRLQLLVVHTSSFGESRSCFGSRIIKWTVAAIEITSNPMRRRFHATEICSFLYRSDVSLAKHGADKLQKHQVLPRNPPTAGCQP